MILFNLLCALLLVLALSTNETKAQWVQTVGSSREITCLSVTGSKAFAGTSGAGVLLSTNRGTSWTPMDTGLTDSVVTALVIIQGDIFAGTPDGVFLSADSARSWTNVSSDLSDTNVTSISALLSIVPIVGTMNGHFFYSTDEGMNWNEEDSGLEGIVNSFAIISDTLVFAGTSNGVFFSPPGEPMWLSVNSGFPHNPVLSLGVIGTDLFAGTNGAGVYVSSDNGTDWTSDNSGLTDQFVQSLEVVGSDIFAGTMDGVFLSSDKGQTWIHVSKGLPDSTDVLSLAADSTSLYAGTLDNGIWRRPLSEMITAVRNQSGQLPRNFGLEQNYPDPFNPTTTIGFTLGENSAATLSIFNVLGQRVQEFDLGRMSAGTYTQTVDMSRSASGVYFYRIEAVGSDGERFVATKKMMVLK